MEKRIPVVVIGDVKETDRICTALIASGINTAEITFRTACAADAIRYAVSAFPEMEIGAGTVINAEQCEKAIDAGAAFVVSPGLSADVARVCREAGIPYYPGCATPSEIMAALDLGLSVLKFFPADLYGGVKALKTFSSVFPGVRFIPTGGVSRENEAEFLSLKNVTAVGGTYLVKDALGAYGGKK